MTMNTQLAVTGELAHIYMKDGQKLFAVVLNDLDEPSSFDEEVRYVRPGNLSSWLETSDESLIEKLDPDHVDGIDLYLK